MKQEEYHIHPPPALTPTHAQTAKMAAEELRARLKDARRVVIKAGTSVVSTPEGYPSLVRLANIVEQVCGLVLVEGVVCGVKSWM